MIKKLILLVVCVIFIPSICYAAPLLLASSSKSGLASGFEGSGVKGSAISIYGRDLGASGSVIACGQTILSTDATYMVEWNATTNPTTPPGIGRITFFLKNTMTGSAGIYITVGGESSNTLPFTIGTTGTIYVYPNDAAAQGWGDLDEAGESLTPGDFLYIKSGSYSDSIRICNPEYGPSCPGSSDNHITWQSYPGEVATFTGSYFSFYSAYWNVANIKRTSGSLVLGSEKQLRYDLMSSWLHHINVTGVEVAGNLDECLNWNAHQSEVRCSVFNAGIGQDDTSYNIYARSGWNRVFADNHVYGGTMYRMHYYDEFRGSSTGDFPQYYRILDGAVRNVGGGQVGFPTAASYTVDQYQVGQPFYVYGGTSPSPYDNHLFTVSSVSANEVVADLPDGLAFTSHNFAGDLGGGYSDGSPAIVHMLHANDVFERNIFDARETNESHDVRSAIVIVCKDTNSYKRSGSIYNLIIRNNVFYGDSTLSSGLIQVRNTTHGLKIYNNTFDDNPTGIAMLVDSSYITDVDIKNNIFSDITTDINILAALTSEVTVTQNLYHDVENTVNCNDTSPVIGDPTFTNEGARDYSLQSGSYGIDRGITLSDVSNDFLMISRPQNLAYDIGAYEYDSGDGTPTPSTMTGVTIKAGVSLTP